MQELAAHEALVALDQPGKNRIRLAIRGWLFAKRSGRMGTGGRRAVESGGANGKGGGADEGAPGRALGPALPG
jgi:hypothetical protein